MAPAAVVGGVLLVGAVALLLGYNHLVTLHNRARSAWAEVEVQLARRHALIPDLVRIVAGHAGHERAVLDAVTRAGAAAVAAEGLGPQPQADAEARLDAELARFAAVAEGYPPLQADRSFLGLQEELAATETKIAFSRQVFNDAVDAYRRSTQSFPLLLLARASGFAPPAFFAAEEAERRAAAVQLTQRESGA